MFRSRHGLQLCLVSTSRNNQILTFPKGLLKKDEPWTKGALRELEEEAGVSGKIILPRTPLIVPNKKLPDEGVILYWCEITGISSTWAEQRLRRRVFYPIDQVPVASLNRTARIAHREILDLNLGEPERSAEASLGLGDWIRTQLLGIRLRPELGQYGKQGF